MPNIFDQFDTPTAPTQTVRGRNPMIPPPDDFAEMPSPVSIGARSFMSAGTAPALTTRRPSGSGYTPPEIAAGGDDIRVVSDRQILPQQPAQPAQTAAVAPNRSANIFDQFDAPAAGGPPSPAQPMAPPRDVGVAQGWLENIENISRGIGQRTNPNVYHGDGEVLRQPLGEITAEGEEGLFYGPADQRTPVNPKTDVVLRDPATGKLTAYRRTTEWDEGGVAGMSRLITQGMATGPVTAPSRAASATSAAGMATRRAADAAADAQAFENLGVRPFGPAFNEGPVASVAKQLSETVGVGAPVRNALQETLTDVGNAANTVASRFSPAASYDEAGNAVRSGLNQTRDEAAAIAHSMAPTSTFDDAGRTVQQGLERFRSAGLDDLDPATVQGMGIAPNSPVPRAQVMSAAAAGRAQAAAPIRQQLGGGTAQTTRGVTVPAARPMSQTLIARTNVEDIDDQQLMRVIRAPAADTSFATRAEALYERAWRAVPTIMRENNTANPNMVAAVNTRHALGQIDQNIANQIAGQGTIGGQLAERIRNPQAGNFQLAELRAIRTEIGRALSNTNPLQQTLNRGQLNSLYGAITRDIEIGLMDLANRAYVGAGRSNNAANHVRPEVARAADGALRQMRTADRYFRQGMERIERYLQIVGTDSPEAASRRVLQAAQSGGRGNLQMLQAARAALRDEEWADVAAMALRDLGAPPATARGLIQEAGFDAPGFMRKWNGMDPRAREVLFGGPQGQAVRDLARDVGRSAEFFRAVGASDGPDAARRLVQAAMAGRGQVGTIRAARHALGNEDWNTVAGMVLRELGQPVGSAREMTQKIGFSVQSFTTRWQNMDPRVKAMMFNGEHRKAVDDLVRVANRMANVEATYNTSRSATNALNVGSLLASGGAVATGAADGLLTLLGSATAGYGASLLFSRPSYVRWMTKYLDLRAAGLSRTGKANSNAPVLAHLRRLEELMRNDPTIGSAGQEDPAKRPFGDRMSSVMQSVNPISAAQAEPRNLMLEAASGEAAGSPRGEQRANAMLTANGSGGDRGDATNAMLPPGFQERGRIEPTPERRSLLLPFKEERGGGVSLAWPGIVAEPYNAMNRLITYGYQPGTNDVEGVRDAADVAGAAGTGGFAASRALAPANALGIFGGKLGAQRLADRGVTGPLRALELAEGMEAAGATRVQIEDATRRLLAQEAPGYGGISRGRDGQWRFEIDDSRMTLNESRPDHSTLDAEVNHPALFAAYPELGRVGLTPMDETSKASAANYRNVIEMKESLPPKEAREILLHEMQHGVQDLEGFAVGTHPDRARPIYDLDAMRKTDPAVVQAIEEAQRLMMELQAVGSGPGNPSYDRMLAMRNELIEQAAGFTGYHRAAGEVEARNVMARADLTPGQRRSTHPVYTEDVPRGSQHMYGTSPRRGSAPFQDEELGNANLRRARVQQQALDLTRDVRDFESALAGRPPEEIARAIEGRYGFPVDPEDIANKSAWWHMTDKEAGMLTTPDVRETPLRKPASQSGNSRPAGFSWPDNARRLLESDMPAAEVAQAVNEQHKKANVTANAVRLQRSRSGSAGEAYGGRTGAGPAAPHLTLRRGRWVIYDNGKEISTRVGEADRKAAEGVLADYVRGKSRR